MLVGGVCRTIMRSYNQAGINNILPSKSQHYTAVIVIYETNKR